MYKNIFEKIFGFIGLTGIVRVDGWITAILAVLIHSSVYSIVGFLYKLDIIRGRIIGRILYFLMWLISLIICVWVAQILKKNMLLLIIVVIGLLIYNFLCLKIKIHLL